MQGYEPTKPTLAQRYVPFIRARYRQQVTDGYLRHAERLMEKNTALQAAAASSQNEIRSLQVLLDQERREHRCHTEFFRYMQVAFRESPKPQAHKRDGLYRGPSLLELVEQEQATNPKPLDS